MKNAVKNHQLIYNSIIKAGSRNKDIVFSLQTIDGFQKEYKVATLFSKVNNLEKDALSCLEKDDKILDVGAGAGRISLFLQKKGFYVDALESSKTICGVLKKRRVRGVINVDIFNFSPRIKYEIILLINSYSILGKSKENTTKLFLHLMRKVLKGDGKIILINSPIGAKEVKVSKRRFVFKDKIGPWFESVCLSLEDLVKITRRNGLKVEAFKKNKTGKFFIILKNY